MAKTNKGNQHVTKREDGWAGKGARNSKATTI